MTQSDYRLINEAFWDSIKGAAAATAHVAGKIAQAAAPKTASAAKSMYNLGRSTKQAYDNKTPRGALEDYLENNHAENLQYVKDSKTYKETRTGNGGVMITFTARQYDMPSRKWGQPEIVTADLVNTKNAKTNTTSYKVKTIRDSNGAIISANNQASNDQEEIMDYADSELTDGLSTAPMYGAFRHVRLQTPIPRSKDKLDIPFTGNISLGNSSGRYSQNKSNYIMRVIKDSNGNWVRDGKIRDVKNNTTIDIDDLKTRAFAVGIP